MHPDAIRTALTPVVAESGCSIYDVGFAGTGKARTLQVLVDRPGGIDLDGVAEVTRAVSVALDDLDPVVGGYTLEVGSPGLERPLRRPDHFLVAVGETVIVKFRDDAGAAQRVTGVLVGASADACTVDGGGATYEIPYDQVTAARTSFVWGADDGSPDRPTPKSPSKTKSKSTSKARVGSD